jgi:hypothetical protein
MLHDLQQQFRAAVLGDADGAIGSHVKGPRAGVRLGVYRNNVQASLREVLAGTYAVVARIVGAAYFRHVATGFVTRNPPRAPQLWSYGGDFPEALAAHEVSARLPYLPDVARLAWAHHAAYFAADAEPLDPDALAAIPPDRIADVRFTGHPATRLIRSPFPIVTIWSVNQPEVRDVPEIDMSQPETALVTRPQHSITVRSLSSGDAVFTDAALMGATLGAAADTAMATGPFDLQEALAGHLVHGTFSELRAPV